MKNKVILITGGTGSFGRACIRHLLTQEDPAKVIVLSRDEWKQWEMQTADPLFRDSRLRYFLGDIRDIDRLRRAFHEVDIIIHAAALKQVPTAEYNPSEAVKTNVLGAMNLIDAAIDAGVEQVIGLSTDKAVNPVNLYGATKLCADKLLVAANVYVGKKNKPAFSVVRYGNVLNSRGSVLDEWRRRLKEGNLALPLTDLRMTRFWITIEEAVAFVCRMLPKAKGGEIFIPKIPSMKLVDLAQAIAPEASYEVIGVRPGEKIHEWLTSVEEAPRIRSFPTYYCIGGEGGRAVSEDFVYASNTNEQWLSARELRDLMMR